MSAETAYRKPPQAVLDVLNAPATPTLSVSPAKTHAILAEAARYPPIAEVAQPMLRLAGLRINPRNNGPHTPFPARSRAFVLKRLADGSDVPLALPPNPRLGPLHWSPNGALFAFTNATDTAIDLWIGDAASGKTHKVEGLRLNAVTGEPAVWLPDNRTLLVRLVPPGRGNTPAKSITPAGPNIQESSGKAGPVRTYQDMLTSANDEDLFDYYAIAQLAYVDSGTGHTESVGKPGIFTSALPSPDGANLLVTRVHRPYSYLHPYDEFPREIEVWNRVGAVVHAVASLPLDDRVPIDGVHTGPRSARWIATEPAALVWVEALDGGNPKEKVPHRDRLLTLASPFKGEPAEWFKTKDRYRAIHFGSKGDLALVEEYERDKRTLRTWQVNLRKPAAPGRMIWSRNIQDRYGDPGQPWTEVLPNGQRAMIQQGGSLLLYSLGATPGGERPFLDRFDLETGKAERVFRSSETGYETVVAVLDDSGSRIVTRRESANDPPNYFIRSAHVAGAAGVALTHYTDPAPQLRRIKKQLVAYKRADGVPLSFTLYLPPDYKTGTRLPTVVWAYPREFNDANTAGQVSGSPNRFNTFVGPSHLFYLLQGYAVLDDAAMPVVGEPETANNTYVEQIVMDAKAAIDKAVEMGVTDPARVGVGGHSYGAFMTANLLAHSDLFRAGVARSGAYNRTLTPFGFQAERRTFWEATELYLKMSPFVVANKINEPVLLIHGEADNNPGTFPIQSERLYQAIRGHGGTARLVMLPHESHGYGARESIEHTLAEMIAWFDKYVKGAEAR
ncbi:MAG: S9 family peptidase [Bryobacterales bacterium]|nr:S9 family peptidase [Bryobacterales bacterium]